MKAGWLIALLPFLLLPFLAHASDSEKLNSLEGKALFVKLVETAYKYDAYNKLCRGISVARESHEVNRLLLRKYGLTLNNFIKLNIERNTRAYQDNIEQSFQQTLFKMGGCEGADETDLLVNFKHHYKLLFENAQASPWFPRT